MDMRVGWKRYKMRETDHSQSTMQALNKAKDQVSWKMTKTVTCSFYKMRKLCKTKLTVAMDRTNKTQATQM